jgi:hypothetical protein
MNRVIVPVALVLVLGGAALALWPKPATPANAQANPPAATTGPTLMAAPLALSGVLETPDRGPNVRVVFSVGGTAIADVPSKDGRWSVSLPAQLKNLNLGSLADLRLVHGYGRLKPNQANAEVRGAAIKLQSYNDDNANQKLDAGETTTDLGLFPSGKEPGLKGFFRYELLVLSGDASLKATEDAPSGAKGYYRYDLSLKAGYSLLEGELASNGYDVRQVVTKPQNNYDAFIPQRGGGEGPPTLRP